MTELLPYLVVAALIALGVGLSIIGIVFYKAMNMANSAGKWEKDFYRIRDENNFLKDQEQFKDTENERLAKDRDKHKKLVDEITGNADLNKLFPDAPATGDTHLTPPGGEKTINSDDEKGVL